MGAVCIVGAKWCGKTSSAEQVAASSLYMQDPDYAKGYLSAASTQPSILLDGKTPRLIDEWQTAPVLWDAVRFAVDKRVDTGQFLLTGSAVPTDDSVMHSGTGRIARLQMRPMSLMESKESSGEVSLLELFDGKQEITAFANLDVENLAFAVARGGWPGAVTKNNSESLDIAQQYVKAIIEEDIRRVDGVERSPARVQLFLRSYARNISTEAPLTTIRSDIAADDEPFSMVTMSDYANALKRIFVVEDLPAWQPALRSKTAIRSTPVRHFVDPSIGIAALQASPQWLLNDFETFGLYFESLCVRDLRVYAQALGGTLFHYRDKSGLEVDAVIALANGRWALVECKMGSNEEEDAARNLLALSAAVDAKKMGAPTFCMILTAGKVAYRRDDGVLVVPLGCLGA